MGPGGRGSLPHQMGVPWGQRSVQDLPALPSGPVGSRGGDRRSLLLREGVIQPPAVHTCPPHGAAQDLVFTACDAKLIAGQHRCGVRKMSGKQPFE